MELINGTDLGKLIMGHQTLLEKVIRLVKKKTFRDHWNTQEDFIKQVVNPMIRGTRCLHEHRIAHRDIRPYNIMFDENERRAKLVVGSSLC